MGNLSFKKKVGIKQAAKRENDFYRILTFNMLQMENKVILTISSDYWKRTFFLPLDRLVSQLVIRIWG